MNFFSININTDNKRETYINIGELLNLSPDDGDHYNINNPDAEWDSKFEKRYSLWVYGVNIENEDLVSDSINKLLDLIEPNINKLEKIRIQKSDMFFILLNGFDGVSMFHLTPETLKRLGEMGITMDINSEDITIEKHTELTEVNHQ